MEGVREGEGRCGKSKGGGLQKVEDYKVVPARRDVISGR